MANDIIQVNDVIEDGHARVNVTWAGQNGDLPDPVHFDSTDADIKQWITEAVRNGDVPGIAADPNADFTDFVIDRFPPSEVRNFSLLQLRSKTPFGHYKCTHNTAFVRA